jgi:hypothetical protein
VRVLLVSRVAMGLLVCLLLALPAGARASECGNEAVRVQQAATFLPECRAYELVSPGSDPYDGNSNNLAEHAARVSLSGGAVSYFAYYPAEGTETGGYYYLSRRGDDGWSIAAQAPQDSAGGADKQLECEQELYFSPELTASILGDGWDIEEEYPGDAPCKSSLVSLAADTPVGYGNLLLREGEGAYQLVNVTADGVKPGNAELQDATPTFGSVLFGEKAQLTPEAPTGGYDLYDWTGGTVRLVSFLPDGEAVNGELADGHERFEHTGGLLAQDNANRGQASWAHAVSEDDGRVFFYAKEDLYVRENPTESESALSGETCTEPTKACTVEVDASQGGEGVSGGGVFWYASADGERVFFADESKLTIGSNATTSKPDLYEYDLETGVLTDITPGSKSEPGNVRGFSGGSEDASYVYFVAESDVTGSRENQYGAMAQKREPNLYLYHEGAMTFIATLEAPTNVSDIGDEQDWQEDAARPNQNAGVLTARVSANGDYLAFDSIAEPTGFDNAPAESGDCETAERVGASVSCDEVFFYDAAANTLQCASCLAGQLPTGNAELPQPTLSTFKAYGGPAYLSRNVLDDGQMFFTTAVSLVPQDTDDADDVYEFDEGVGRLISTGTSETGAIFEDASASGDDVLMLTAQRLVGDDTNNGDSIYDARVEGGFEEPEEAVACSGEVCDNGYQAGTLASVPASITFTGPGNTRPKTSKHAKKGKKHAKKHEKHKHRANTNKDKHRKKTKKGKKHRSGVSGRGGSR